MSSCTTTVPNSVRNRAPVGQTSRQPAFVQCLQTFDDINQRNSVRSPASACSPGGPIVGIPSSTGGRAGLRCSMKATCRQLSALSPPVLSYDVPSRSKPSAGSWFHSLQATSHALHPMQIEVSVKKPLRGGGAAHPASSAGLVDPNG